MNGFLCLNIDIGYIILQNLMIYSLQYSIDFNGNHLTLAHINGWQFTGPTLYLQEIWNKTKKHSTAFDELENIAWFMHIHIQLLRSFRFYRFSISIFVHPKNVLKHKTTQLLALIQSNKHFEKMDSI